jgi:Txe/YoeB family toxin of Txe-Axe toxin-antitoxin module
VTAAVKRWPEFAAKAELSEQWLRKIQKQHRLDFSRA